MKNVTKKHFYIIGIIALGALGCHATTKLSRPCAELVINHLQVIRELKTRAAKIQEEAPNSATEQDEGFSQTDAHLSFPALYNNVVTEWKDFFQEQATLVNDIISNERRHSNAFVVCYHAQRAEFLIAQDFIKEIFELLYITKQHDTFAFLRFWDQIPQTVNANTFIDENNKKGFWSDHDPKIAKEILSANLSLFGNCTFIDAWECTFDYFLANRSVMSGIDLKKILTDIFNHFGFDKRYINLLTSLLPRIKSDHGLLVQICIPKTLVDQCVYLSHPLGIPFTVPIPGGSFDTHKKRNLQIEPIISLYAEGNQGFNHLLETDESFKKTVQELAQQHGLDADNPEELLAGAAILVDRFQARILFSRDIMLNPASGVEIYRYTTIDDASMAEYTTRLKKIAREVVTKWLESNEDHQPIQGSKLDTLLTQLPPPSYE